MIRDQRDELITALIRKLGGQAVITEREMAETERCTIEMSLDLNGAAIYRVMHPDDAKDRSTIPPNLLLAALMDYSRERDLSFSREFLQLHMSQYTVEITDNRQEQTTRIRMWAYDEQPPSPVNPAPEATEPVQAQATRVGPLAIEDAEVVDD